MRTVNRHDSRFFSSHTGSSQKQNSVMCKAFIKKNILFFIMTIIIFLNVLFSSVQEKTFFYLAQGSHFIAEKAGFSVSHVLLEGRQNTPRNLLRSTLNLHRGQSIFSSSPAQLKEKIQQLPWIRSAVVERRFPDTFYIRLAERQPVAIWQNQGRHYLIDEAGEKISLDPQDFPRFLLKIVGEKAPQHAVELLEILEQFPSIKRQVIAAVFLRSGRWDLHLEPSLVIKLPETNIDKALKHFLSFEKNYATMRKKIAVLDFRLPHAFVLRLRCETKSCPTGGEKIQGKEV